MAQNTCPSCNAELAGECRFCPNCGRDLEKLAVCPNCKYPNASKSRFCQECGTPLPATPTTKARAKPKPSEAPTAVVELEPPPSSGITIEFPYSSAQAFDFAVECAKKFPTFSQYGAQKKSIYRVTFQPHEMESATDLAERLKGWRHRTVYVDGEKVTWDSVFSFEWCYERKKASFKPELHCFGYENEYAFNVWGCIQAQLPFTQNARWFCWGAWLNDRGDWKFDKERIRHELEKALYPYRFCPALRHELLEDVLSALPDVVNPRKDGNWRFVERWGDESLPGLVVTVRQFGIEQKIVMAGVCPAGQGALKELAKRMRFRLPQGP